MTPAFAFFILRVVLTLLLLSFLGTIFYLLWHDLKNASHQAQDRQQARGRLVIIETGLPPMHVGDSFPLLPITSIGRAPTNTAPLPDDTASLEHALVHLRAGRWWLEDLESRNGTRLNNARIEQPVPVSAGDVIEVGRVKLKVEIQ